MNPTLQTILTILLIILAVVVVAAVVLYFVGRKMQSRQADQQALLEANKQTVSMLIIDKKKMKIQDAGFPKIVAEQAPKYARFMKYPVVKAKVGPKIVTLMADPQVFEILPVKTECKVVVSGIYITELKSVRGGSVPKIPEKKGVIAKIRNWAADKMAQANAAKK